MRMTVGWDFLSRRAGEERVVCQAVAPGRDPEDLPGVDVLVLPREDAAVSVRGLTLAGDLFLSLLAAGG